MYLDNLQSFTDLQMIYTYEMIININKWNDNNNDINKTNNDNNDIYTKW